jgi:4-amino-4-deoxy-L-arabinose transferase-like glycosyltransferase
MEKTNKKSISNSRIILIALIIFLSALIIRLAVAVSWHPKIIDDQMCYLKIATSLANGTGFKQDGIIETYRDPLYPAFVAVIYNLTAGDPAQTVTIIQAFFSALTCIFIFLLTQKLWGEKIGIIAGIISIFTPDFILYNCVLLTESLYMLITALLIWCVYRYGDKTLGWIIAAFLLGLAALTRPFALIFIPFLLYWLYSRKRLKIHKLVIFLLITIAVISPWTVRNYNVTGHIVPITSAGGINLWIGNNEKGTGEYRWIKQNNPYEEQNLAENEKISLCYAEVFRFIVQKPLAELKLLALKAILFISPTGDKFYIASHYLQPTLLFFLTGLFFEFLLFGAIGIVFSNYNKGTALLWFYIISVYIGVIIFFFQERFRITAYITLIPLAAAGWMYLWDKNKRRRKILILATVVGIQLILGILALIFRPDYIEHAWKIFSNPAIPFK